MNQKERQELVKYRISKARVTYNEVELHVENKLWNTAINRLYYACYYVVIALLIDKDIQAQTHAGVRQMFGLHFVKSGLIDKESGKFYTDIFDMRQTGDYDDYIDFSKEDVLDLIEPANKLITKIEGLLLKKIEYRQS
jgi:uncharacterized protein (UPF0332 family)